MKLRVFRTTHGSPHPAVPPAEGTTWVPTPHPHDPYSGHWIIDLRSMRALQAFCKANGQEVIVSFETPPPGLDGSLEIYDGYRE